MTEKSAAELEREAEAVRARVADTAETLRSKMTPGQMIDEFSSMVTHGDTGQAFRNLKNQVRDNPLPLALVGAGLAWLMLGHGPSASRIRSSASRFSSRDETYDENWDEEIWDDEAWDDEVATSNFGPGGSASDVYGGSRYGSARPPSGSGEGESLMGKVTGAARSALSSASEAISGAKDTLSDAGHRVGSTASHLGSGAGSLGRKAGRYGKSARRGIYSGTERISQAGRRISHRTGDLVDREPLLLAAFGLAAGAAIGALIPRTRTEEEYLGEYGRKLRDTGEDLLERGVDEVKDVASEAYQAAKEEADRQGLSPSGDGSLANKVASVAKAAAGTTEEAVREKASAAKPGDTSSSGKSDFSSGSTGGSSSATGGSSSASKAGESSTTRSDEPKPGWPPS